MRFFLFVVVFHVIAFNAQEKHQPISGHVYELIGNDSIVPLVGVNVFYSDQLSEGNWEWVTGTHIILNPQL